jgi:hypothetical protein
MPVILAVAGKHRMGGWRSRLASAKLRPPSPKLPEQKAGGVAYMVEHLPRHVQSPEFEFHKKRKTQTGKSSEVLESFIDRNKRQNLL